MGRGSLQIKTLGPLPVEESGVEGSAEEAGFESSYRKLMVWTLQVCWEGNFFKMLLALGAHFGTV